MPNTWADLDFGARAPNYSDYLFIASKLQKLPLTLSEPEYNDLMAKGNRKTGPLTWANAIEWKMFELMGPQVDASDWFRRGYAKDLCAVCKQFVTDREEMERYETENELVRYEFTSIRIVSLAGPDLMSGNRRQPEIKLEVQEEGWGFGQPSNGSFHQPVC